MRENIINNRYKILIKIGEGGTSVVYKGYDEKEQKDIAIKILKNEVISNRIEDIIRFRSEAMTVSNINHKNIIRIYETGYCTISEQSSPYIVMEYIDGKSLYDILSKNEQISFENKIKVLIDISQTLEYIHGKGIIHRDLKPSNIILNLYSTKLIDFGLAQVKEFTHITSIDEIVGTFSYMSPEQSGIIKRNIDERSDLYSLGILSYQLLTGSLPYQGKDISSIIHQHIARDPESLSKLNNNIPQVLDRIILKLMEKEPEKRYQSARGLLNDLKKFQNGKTYFEPGMDDRVFRLSYRTELVGREEEINKLKRLFDNTQEGNGGICFVIGEAGKGKTRLVNELRNYVYLKNGLAIEGKCFSGENKIPYLAFKDSLDMYLKIFDKYSIEKKNEVRNKIKEVVGELGEIILRINPLMKEVIGECPVLVQLDGEKENQRFLTVVNKFFQELARIEGALVIFLDDLQWVEEGSLSILNQIINNIVDIPILIVGNYRDNEVLEEHILRMFIDNIKNNNIAFEEIKLSNFDDEKMNKFIAGILFDKEEKVKEISDFVFNKSKGNPFLSIEITRQLVDNKAIEREEGSWKINYDLLDKLEFFDTIVDTLLKRIYLLSENEKELLSYATLIGRKFEMELLFDILENYEKEDVVKIIDKGVELHLLELDFAEKGKIIFAHDRIKEAFENIIDKGKKTRIHLKIAQRIEERNKEEILQNINECSALFDLVNHYAMTENIEKTIEYAYPAGIKAQKSYANEEAIRYFNIVINLLEGINSKLVIKSKKNIAEIYLVVGRFDEAIELSKEILEYEEIKNEKAIIYKNISQAYFKKGNWIESESYAKIGLKILGEKLPIKIFGVIFDILKNMFILLLHSLFPKVFIRKKLNPRSEKYKLIIWYYYVLSWVYILSDTLKMARVIIRMKNITESKIGVSEEMAYAYAAFGSMLMTFAIFKKAEKYHKKAIEISEKYNYKWTLGESYQFLSANYLWQANFIKNIDSAIKSIDIFNKIGDSRELGITLNHLVHGYMNTSKYENSISCSSKYHNMSIESNDIFGITASSGSFTNIYLEYGDYKTSENYGLKGLNVAIDNKLDFNICFLSIYLGSLYLEQNIYDKSLYHLTNVKKLDEKNNFLKYYIVDVYPLLCDLYIELYKNKLDNIKKIKISQIKKLCKHSLKATKSWVTYYGRALRVNAKYFSLIGKNKKANKYFIQSIEKYSKIGRKYEEAKGYYEYGLFLKNINREEEAKSKWEKAYQIFKEIDSKVYLKRVSDLLDIKHVETDDSSIQRLQYKQKLSTIIKISQDISLIFNLNELLERIMEKAIEVTGAQTGLLFIYNDTLKVLDLKVGKNILNQDMMLKFSHNIIEQVYESGKVILTTNAEEDKDLSKFNSVKILGLKSILCLPIMLHAKKIGVCYLDNPLSSDIFSYEDVELMKVFMSQAAISIENTKMYKELDNLNKILEQKVEERTEELKLANEQKTQFFVNIAHETKTPLTLIKNYLDQYIKETQPTKKLDVIKNNIDKLLRDMVNFLEAEKLKGSRVYYNHEQITDFTDILEKRITLFYETAKQKHINLSYKAGSVPIFVKVDPYAIDSIITNLIDNAIKYTKENGEVRITLEEKGNTLLFSVKDTGIGIPDEQINSIFKPFHQLSYKKKNIQGIGMGLFIVYKIIESLNGSINVKSKVNEGSNFIVTLKTCIPEETENIQKDIYLPPAPNDNINDIELKEKEIDPEKNILLLVEDNVEMLDFLVTELQEYYNVFFAENGKLALTKIRDIPKPDIIISDIMMDEMDGIEFFKNISVMEKYHDIPFIFLTAKTGIEDKLSGLRAGAIDYIEKPFLIEELRLRINSILINLKKQKLGNFEVIEKSIDETITGLKMKTDKEAVIKFNKLEKAYKKYNISNKEKIFLELVQQGYQNKEISSILNVTLRTVENQLHHIYKKLNVKNRIELFNLLFK